MAKSKTKANEKAKRSEKENPIGIVAGFRQIVQLEVTEMVRETQTCQKVKAQTEQLREEVAHLRRLLEMAMQQRGTQPATQ
ncbi:hypothetical protein B0813_001923 [Candidatus Fervidibacteria bacterium JGI MDM2 SSWTFF-3-K9]